MKGLAFLTDETNNRKLLQIDMDKLVKNPDLFGDLMDIIICETRKKEPKISWKKAKKKLNK
ncbi:MAG: hypothetical protein K2X48_13380 [Chitinophagaceae bacterium]|nr:hypothetical protein [Chitinophagaceae bacterium]